MYIHYDQLPNKLSCNSIGFACCYFRCCFFSLSLFIHIFLCVVFDSHQFDFFVQVYDFFFFRIVYDRFCSATSCIYLRSTMLNRVHPFNEQINLFMFSRYLWCFFFLRLCRWSYLLLFQWFTSMHRKKSHCKLFELIWTFYGECFLGIFLLLFVDTIVVGKHNQL